MKNLRREDLSIHHFVRFNILNEYIETDSNVALSFLPDVSTTGSYVYQADSNRFPPPNSFGRGWSYIDAYGDITEQTSTITVYDEFDNVISGSEYMVDYADGRIITSGTVEPVKVTYKYFYVAQVGEWNEVEASDVPVVVVDIEITEKEGFQLGGGKRVPRRGHFHIFATNQAERDDLIEMLYDGIYNKCCPNQNWTKGAMLDWNGTFNHDYVYELIQYHSALMFENVIARTLSIPLRRIPSEDMDMLSDLNRYRGRIDFDVFHWEEV